MIALRISMATVFLAGISLAGCESSPPPATPPPAASASPAPTAPTSPLAGTSWQLVKFSGSDGSTVEPDDRSKYTITFQPDGVAVARIDCNRGHGTWKSTGPNHLEFGPLALTRAMCPPGSMQDRLAADWGAVRSYTVKDGHLFLSLMADGGTYEYETAAGAAP